MTGLNGYRKAWPVIVVVLGVLGIAAATAFWFIEGNREAGEELSALRAENEQLRAQSAELNRQLEELHAALPEAREAAPAPSGDPARRGREKEQQLAETQTVTIRELQASLNTANHSLSEMHGRIQELENSLEGIRAENQRLSSLEEELGKTVASTQRVVDAMDTELKDKTSRITKLELTNRELQQRQTEAQKGRAELDSAVQQLEEINRRRDVYLTNILRRYRDMTDQYRALASRWDQVAADSAAPGNEISRIQDAIALAEEDMRQLNSINSRAAALQKKLAGN